MGRYGMNTPHTSSTFQTKKTITANYDEVDNVMSKISRSPRGLEKDRRNSWPYDEFEQNSESDINFKIADHALAKSAPTKLPSYLYYRDTADVETENYQSCDNIKFNSSNTIREKFYTPPNNRNKSAVNQRYNQIIERTNNKRFSRQDPKASYLKLFIAMLVRLIINPLCIRTTIVIIVLNVGINLLNFSSNVYDESKFLKELTIIEQKYNIGSDAILQIQSGVSATYKKEDTVTYIFVYNSKNQKNYKHFKNFVNEVANVSAQYLRNNNTVKNQHLVVQHDELNMKDHGELVNKIRQVFNDRGVILFENLGKVPVHLVRAFHYYCDEFNPLAKRSAVLFTMDLDDCAITLDEGVSHNVLEKCLSEKWSSLPDDVLYPLLTRVIHIIVDLTKIY